MFIPPPNPGHFSRFDRYCEHILSSFSKKWNPHSARADYMDTFSIQNWKELPNRAKQHHSMSYCNACYNAYPSQQKAFPGKPVYEPQTTVSIPDLSTERDSARGVLAELNLQWENKFSHSFTECIPTLVPESALVRRVGRTENKTKERAQKERL